MPSINLSMPSSAQGVAHVMYSLLYKIMGIHEHTLLNADASLHQRLPSNACVTY